MSPDVAPGANKPVILTFVRFYLPGFKSGGPVRTIANIVEALSDEFEFRIVTQDRDVLDDSPYSDINLSQWNKVGKAWVYYVPIGEVNIWAWRNLIRNTPHDLIYLNSLFAPWYSLMPLIAIKLMNASRKPVVIAPRGELSPGAVDIKKWKKRPFIIVARLLGFYRNVLWHASTEDEARLIGENIGAASNIAIAVNIPANNAEHRQRETILPRPKGVLRLAFLSRVSRKKNLDYALRILAKTPVQIQLDIWGILEDKAYWATCQDLIAAMPENVTVRYCGEASPAEVVSLLSGYDLLFLPTRGENYGHVIAEAMSAGTPVLISDQTPWRGLYKSGVGWDLPLEEDGHGFLQAIREVGDKTENELAQWRERVRKYAEHRLRDDSILESNRQLFLQAMGALKP